MSDSEEWNGSCSDGELLSRNSTSPLWKFSGAVNISVIVTVSTLLALGVAVGFIWNIIIVASIFKLRLYRDVTHVILLNLVGVDFLWYALVIPIDLVSIAKMEFVFGQSDYVRCYSCKVYVVLSNILTDVAICLFALMSVDRLIYIKWPLKYENFVTLWCVSPLLLSSWILSFLICFPLLLDFGEVRPVEYTYCRLYLPESVHYTTLMCALWLPMMVLIVASNAWILFIAHKMQKVRLQRNLGIHPESLSVKSMERYTRRHNKEQVKVSYTFGSIISINLFHWILLGSLRVITSFEWEKKTLEVFTILFHVVDYLQPFLHLVVETGLIPKGRQLILKTFCLCLKRKN